MRNALQSAAMRISSGREQRLLRHSLLIVEVGLAVVLLTSAGLLIRSFVNVLSYDSGFDPSNTLTGVTLISGQQYDATKERIWRFVDQVLPRLQALPGVQAAALASALPLEATLDNSAITACRRTDPSHRDLADCIPDQHHAGLFPRRWNNRYSKAAASILTTGKVRALVAIVNQRLRQTIF